MANRYLQLKRNAVVAESLAAAQAKLNESDFLADKLDGELVVARYKIDPEGGVEQSNVGIVEGHVYSKDGVKFVIFIDSESGKETLDNLKEYVGQTESEKLSANTAGHTYVSASTNVTDALNDLSDNLDHAMSEIGLTSGDTIENHVGDTNYITGATTVLSALTVLDSKLEEVSGNSEDLRNVVGVDKNVTAITDYISGNTYISGDTNIVEVINDIDNEFKNVYSAITEASPESTGKTIVVTEAKDRTDGGSKANIEVNNDKKTIKQASATGNTYEHTATTVGANELYVADAIIENGFSVLGVTAGTWSTGDKVESGMTVSEILKKILIKEADCTPVVPYITLSINPTATTEVGSVVDEVLTVAYTDGHFTGSTDDYGPEGYDVSAGCAEGNVTYKYGSTTLTTAGTNSYTDSSRTMAEGANTWTAQAKYGASTVTPKKNTGDDSTQSIAAGSTTTVSKTVNAYYKYYIGNTTALTYNQLTSSDIKAADIVAGSWISTITNKNDYSKKTKMGVANTNKIALENTNQYTSNGNSIFVAVPSQYELWDVYSSLGASIGASFMDTTKGASIGTVSVAIGGTSTNNYNVYLFPITTGAKVTFANVALHRK